MILTVTFNPAFDWNIATRRLMSEEKNPVIGSSTVAGGKGVNVSRVLTRLGVPNRAFVVLGRKNALEYRKLALKENLRLVPCLVTSKTRTNITLVQTSSCRQIRLNHPGPDLNRKDLRRVAVQLRKAMRSCRVVVFAGSLPPGMTVKFFSDCVRLSIRLGKRTVVDSSGKALKAVSTLPLWLIKPNMKEWISIGRKAPRAHWLLVSDGARGAKLSGGSGIWKCKARKRRPVSTVGAGDSLLAGFLAEFRSDETNPQEALSFGVAAGTASVVNQAGRLADASSIRRMS